MRYALFFLCALLVTGCARKAPIAQLPAGISLAVAPVEVPLYDWELMAGVLPDEPTRIDSESLAALDVQMSALLDGTSGRTVMKSAAVRKCEQQIVESKPRQRFSAPGYWREVGRCLSSDYVLVPQISRWEERAGGEWGVERPAAVTVDLYLVDVATGQVRRYHFEEQQQGLAENLLKGKRFFKRKGKWLTPQELACEAFEAGIEELGL